MRQFLKLVFGLAGLVTIIVFLALTLEIYVATEEITVTVKKIEKIETDDGEKYYHVHTNKGIFVNRNNTFHRKDNTRTIFKILKKNIKYKIKVVGYNFGIKLPFFFNYRNIIAVTDGPNILPKKLR